MQGLNSSVITAHEVLNVQGPNYGQLADGPTRRRQLADV